MTFSEIRERVAGTGQAPVRVVDSDVHPVPKPGMLSEYLSDVGRRAFDHKIGETIFYDAPDYAHAKAMRVDAFVPGGGFPGSDPDLAFRQLVVEAGSDVGILEPGGRAHFIPEVNSAIKNAVNHWIAGHWLDSANNWHGRWRGSICAAIEDPQGAVREIEQWAGHPYMSQILITAEPRPAWGDPKYDPIWATAVKHDLPVSCHLSRNRHEQLPMPPVGFPSYNHDFMVTYSLLAANQVMSLIFDGVFERFPTLRIILVEHAFTWILPLMWRMDAIYEARKSDIPDIRRKPSEYVKDNIWFTTQPLDYPEDKLELTNALEWMEADKILLFSSDYPHWTFDDPRWVIKHIPEPMRAAIMRGNGIAVYKNVPETVPAIEGQTIAY